MSDEDVSTLKKYIATILLSAALALSAGYQADGASIEFDMEDLATSGDFAELMKPLSRLAPLDDPRYAALSAKYAAQDLSLTLSSGDEFRIMLVCDGPSSPGPANALKNIQLLVVDDRGAAASVRQRLKLGDGEAPQLLYPGGASDFTDIMVRVLRTGNNAESYVYAVNRASGSLSEALRIGRSFPERMKLSVKGRMQAGGRIEVESTSPKISTVVDMSAALDALVEDGLYQENGRPVPALVNLTCVRNGWEDERIHLAENGVPTLEVGVSLITSSRKQVVDVTVIMTKTDGKRWGVSDLRFEPFLPYRW